MRVEAVPEWALAPADEAEVADLLDRAFGPDFGGRSFFHQRHHLRLLGRDGGRDGGRIVGHVAVTWRAVRLGEGLVDIAGLAEVATDPARRGEGIARTLVERSIAEARASLATALLLFGHAGLYAGLGFAPAGNPIRHVVMTGARTHRTATARDAGLMVLPLREGGAWDGEAPLDLLGPMF